MCWWAFYSFFFYFFLPTLLTIVGLHLVFAHQNPSSLFAPLKTCWSLLVFVSGVGGRAARVGCGSADLRPLPGRVSAGRHRPLHPAQGALLQQRKLPTRAGHFGRTSRRIGRLHQEHLDAHHRRCCHLPTGNPPATRRPTRPNRRCTVQHDQYRSVVATHPLTPPPSISPAHF